MLVSFYPGYLPISLLAANQAFISMEGNKKLLENKFWHLTNDTRELKNAVPGVNESLAFWALVAERDGHDFIEKAADNGCRIFWAQHAQREKIKALFYNKNNLYNESLWFWLKDSNNSLMQWAKELSGLLRPKKIIGITGTNGKSSFKEMLQVVLGERAFSSKKNYNNEIGLPFTVFAALHPDNYSRDFFIFEMGMNHPGELRRMSEAVQPDIAVITSIGSGHLEFLQTVERVAWAKSEIMDGMNPQSHIFIPENLTYIDTVINIANSKNISVHKYAQESAYEVQKDGIQFFLNGHSLHLPLFGRHQWTNANGVALLSSFLGLSMSEIAANFEKVALLPGRFSLIEYNRTLIFFDAYNSNPDSLRAGVETMGEIRDLFASKNNSLLWLMGDMRELGEAAASLHNQSGALLQKWAKPNDFLIVFGNHAADYAQGWQNESRLKSFAESERENLKEYLLSIIENYTLVYVKGSRSMQMESLLPVEIMENK